MTRFLPPFVTLAGLLLVWQAAVTVFNVPQYLLPAPVEIGREMVEKWPYLLRHTQVTAFETLLGFGASVAVGVPLAVLIVISPMFGRFVYPLIVGSQTVPKVAIAPLFVVWFGFGLMPKVLIAFLIAFFPVLISTVVGLGSVEADMLTMVRSMGGGRRDEFIKIRMPAAMPSIFGGLKVAVTLAVIGAIVGEFVGTNAGLGYVLLTATGTLDTPMVFAAIFILTVLGIILFYAMELIERRVTAWRWQGGATLEGDSATLAVGM